MAKNTRNKKPPAKLDLAKGSTSPSKTTEKEVINEEKAEPEVEQPAQEVVESEPRKNQLPARTSRRGKSQSEVNDETEAAQEEHEPPVPSQAEEEERATGQDLTTVEAEPAEEAVQEEPLHTEELVVPDQVNDQGDEISAQDDANLEDEAQQNEEQILPDIAEDQQQGVEEHQVETPVEQDEASQGGAEEHQTEEQEFVEISHQEEEQQEQGEEIIHHEVQYITEDGEEHHGQYLVEHEQNDDDETETSEIILCVDTSATGDANEYEVIQPNVFIQKQSSKEFVMQQKPKIRPGPKSSKPAAIAAAAAAASSGPKMVKLTYGLSAEVFDDNLGEDDDSGNMADESEMTEEVETRVIQLTTSSSGGQQFTATTVSSHPNTVKVIKAHNPAMASKVITAGTGGVKRTRDVPTFESYEPEAEYEVDGSGVVVVRKTGASPLKKKQIMDGKSPANSSTAPKSIACYYCSYRAPTVDEMELHLNEEHINEGEEIQRRRIRKRSNRVKESGDGSISATEQSSDFDENSELNMLDETRESRNPNFECWRCNNRSFAGSGSLRRHINAVHLRLGNHPCQYCGKLFSAKHNLKVHTATVHLRQRNYVCVFCNRTYTENRSLKRHIESTHAGQKYEGMDYVYPHKEKGRPRTKQLKYIDSSEVVYESEEQMDSYEMEDEEDQLEEEIVEEGRIEVEEGHHEIEGEHEHQEVQEGEVVVEEGEGNYPMYIVPADEKSTKTQVVIYHDDSISASEEVVVGGEIAIANEEVVITNNVDLAIEENDGMETFEIKLEVNGNQDSYYSMEPVDKSDQVVVYESKSVGEDVMMSGNEVVVANEEEVGEHEQVTIHYIKADGTPSLAGRTTYHVNTSYEDDGSETTPSGTKRKPYQRIKCGYCGDFFCSRQLFYKHANKVHREQLVEDWHCCPECRRYFPSVEAVKLHCSLIHANENKKTECPYCPTMFTRTCTYYRHANQSHLEIISKNWLLCDGCDLYMPEPDKLRQHQVHAHPPRKQKH